MTSKPLGRAPLLRLPLEIRELIYAYLIPVESVSYPLACGITSVSHRPPSQALLNIHPILTTELLAHFYYLATWKLIFSHDFNLFRIDPDLHQLERSPSLAFIRNVEVVFFYDMLLLRDYPSFSMDQFAKEINRRATRACAVLAKAPNLRKLVISWIDTTRHGIWQHRQLILGALQELIVPPGSDRTKVVFKVGDVDGPDDLESKDLHDALVEVIGSEELIVPSDTDLMRKQRSPEYRMLAFDVRQERGLVTAGPGSRPFGRFRRSGWRGAPQALAPPVEASDEVS